MAYDGNELLRGVGERVEYTPEIIQEYIKCRDDVNYFASKYVYIISIDLGEVLIPLRDYQRRILTAFSQGDRFILMAPRQTGKTVMSFIYILHYAIFNDSKEVAVLANKEPQAKEILDRIKSAYERLPKFLQHGIKEWNKKSILLENNSKIFIGTTGSSSVRGKTIALLYLDEFAHIPRHLAQEFMDSVFPTISSSKTAKIIISSTPNGQNYFYDLWQGAIKKINGYEALRVRYQEVPGRDAGWKQSIIKAHGLKHFLGEYNCLKGDSLVTIKHNDEIFEECLDILSRRDCSEYEIETDHGFVKFRSVICKGRQDVFNIALSNGREIKATYLHPFVVDGKTIKLKELKVGDHLQTKLGKEYITSINFSGASVVYDVVDVQNTSSTFFVNGILSHNCSFLGSSSTLINSEFIEKMVYREASLIKYGGSFEIMDKPDISGKYQYILGIDSAEGVGKNYSVAKVFKIVNHQEILDVATYRNNMISPYNFSQVCIEISKYYNNALMMIENNNVGTSVCKHIWYDFECDAIVNMDNVGLGIRSTRQTKLQALLLLKRYIESGYLKIRHKKTVDEFVTFVEKRDGVFGADNTEDTDDCVMACAWGLFFLTTPYYDGSDELHEISEQLKFVDNGENDLGMDFKEDSEKPPEQDEDSDIGSLMFSDNDDEE
jgi:hypothetical protein